MRHLKTLGVSLIEKHVIEEALKQRHLTGQSDRAVIKKMRD